MSGQTVSRVHSTIFELQDHIAESVVVRSPRSWKERRSSGRNASRRKASTPPTLICAGMANLQTGTHDAVNEALPLFYDAMKLDPEFASAYAMGAWCYFWRKVNGWMRDRPREIARRSPATSRSGFGPTRRQVSTAARYPSASRGINVRFGYSSGRCPYATSADLLRLRSRAYNLFNWLFPEHSDGHDR